MRWMRLLAGPILFQWLLVLVGRYLSLLEVVLLGQLIGWRHQIKQKHQE
ncbi:MAG: hypothetical protein ACI8RD_000990 [Bacillariaceae sp.]|jgi:hypothetical protein